MAIVVVLGRNVDVRVRDRCRGLNGSGRNHGHGVYYLLGLGGLRYRFLNIVGLLACVVLLLWPNSVFHPGFQFSYLSVGALGTIAFPRLRSFRAMIHGFTAAFADRILVGRTGENKKRRKAR